MKTLDLEKIWQVMNKLSQKEAVLSEDNIFVSLLGNRSNYFQISFEGFLEYYSFKIENEVLCIFNNDGIPWENYTNDDFSYVHSVLISFSEKELEQWIDDEIKKQLKEQEVEKLERKDYIKKQIKNLENQLNKL